MWYHVTVYYLFWISVSTGYNNTFYNDTRFPDVVGFNMELESFILDGSEQDSLLPVINLGGLFDYPITAGGIRKPGSDVLAALLAIQDVNHNHVIKGFQLRMIFNDSKVRLQLIVLISEQNATSYRFCWFWICMQLYN